MRRNSPSSVISVCLSVCLSAIRSDEGIMLETSAQKLFTVANLQHQLC